MGLSTRNENWKPNSNRPRVKSKNPSPNAETLKIKPKKPSLMPLLWPKNSRKNKINLSISRGCRRTWKPPSKIFNSDSTKPNRLLLKVAENKSRNSKPECENSRTNLTVNSDEPPTPSRTPERSSEKSKKSPSKPKKTRRTCLESKTWSTNSRSKSKPTNDRPKKLKKLPTPTSANTESFSTSWMSR